jgi:lipopolysaccharide transport system permease protein
MCWINLPPRRRAERVSVIASMNSRTTYLYGLTPISGWLSPIGIFGSSWAHRDLIFRLAQREVLARYKGSMLGIIWSVLMPLAMLSVYTFFFGFVLKGKWDVPNPRYNKFFLIVFAGMLVVNLFCACVGRAPTLMLANVNYIKKVVFPLEILPVVVIVSEGFDYIMGTIVLSVGYLCFIGLPPVTALLIPVILLPYVILIIGMLWFISALGVYLRDLRQVVGVVLSVIGFLCPMFFPLSIFPVRVRWVLYLNPLTTILEQVRHVLFYGIAPDWRIYLGYFVCAWGFAWLGRLWFTHAQRGFADVV